MKRMTKVLEGQMTIYDTIKNKKIYSEKDLLDILIRIKRKNYNNDGEIVDRLYEEIKRLQEKLKD